jgi:quaternary ammonium compound-resistance protein SugE
MAWLALLLSGLFEVGFTTCMRHTGGLALVLFVLFAGASFYSLTLAMKSLPLGTCYAVFTAIGAVGTALVGILYFGESASPARVFLLGLIVVVVIGLKWASPAHPGTPPQVRD